MAKSLFLLCCLFPEDCHIPVEDLTYLCMGLGIYGGMINLEDARNKTCSLADFLKSRSLLLDNYDADHVRMHDVVRDVCIYVAKQKGYIGGNNCAWISSSQFVGERIELLTESIFPNLRLLILDGLREEFEFGSAFLEGIKDLYMLSIRNYRKLTSLPATTSSFVNLKTLILFSCGELKSISVIGKLRNLEILICRHCDSIEELPLEMKVLNRLKLLELTRCYQLKSIGRGIISSLVVLEELKMSGSFKRWEAEDTEDRETTRGKDYLPQLEELHLEECRMMQQVFLWSNEEAGLNKISIESRKNHTKVFPKLKVLELVSLPNLTTFYQGIEAIEFPLLTKLQIEECPKMKSIIIPSYEIISSSADIDDDSLHLFGQSGKVSFGSSLKVLEINHNPFFGHQIPSSLFNGLKELTINKYVGSISLFTLSVARNLDSLRKLRIRNCDEMIKVIEDDQQQHRILLFPKLEELELKHLSKLVSFCDWKCEVELPLLGKVEIAMCPNMKNLSMGSVATPNLEAFTTDLTTYVGVGDGVAFNSLKELKIEWNENPFDHHKISVSLFNGLQKLLVYDYKGSMSLFSSAAVGNLVNLKVLHIIDSDKMFVKVIHDEKVVSGGEIIGTVVIFPKLEELTLGWLPKLVRFCEWKCDIEFPSLRQVVIRGCPNMENFSMGFVAASNLKIVKIDHQEIDATEDLNGVLHQHHLAHRETVLEINHNPFSGQEFSSLVHNRLEVLKISKYEGSMRLFTLSVAANLVSLRKLSIENCDEMIKVIEDEEQQERIFVFPKLKELYLENLPKLVSFCASTCEVELPLLKKVVTERWPNMENFSLILVATLNLKYFKTDLTTYVGVGVNVAFNNVKKMEIIVNEDPFYDDKISVSLFNGLEQLIFSSSKGSMSLFSSSTVGILVSLRVLQVSFCNLIVKVIEDDEKVGVSGGEIRSVVFPKLEELTLHELPKLVSFCKWKCDVELPSLKEVKIVNCPKMENFSLGFVPAPNLKMIRINDEYYDVAEELNGVVQQHLAREKRRKKKKVVQRRDETEEDDQN